MILDTITASCLTYIDHIYILSVYSPFSDRVGLNCTDHKTSDLWGVDNVNNRLQTTQHTSGGAVTAIKTAVQMVSNTPPPPSPANLNLIE